MAAETPAIASFSLFSAAVTASASSRFAWSRLVRHVPRGLRARTAFSPSVGLGLGVELGLGVGWG